MKRDLERHKLLRILIQKTLQFHPEGVNMSRPSGILFKDLMSEMNCNREKLEMIFRELYNNGEVSYYNSPVACSGLMCESVGIESYGNSKYKSRYWKDFWSNLFTISQTIVPTLALVVALVAVSKTKQSTTHTEEILLLRKELNKQQELLDFQTKILLGLKTKTLGDTLTAR